MDNFGIILGLEDITNLAVRRLKDLVVLVVLGDNLIRKEGNSGRVATTEDKHLVKESRKEMFLIG